MSIKFEKIRCPLCDEDNFKKLYQRNAKNNEESPSHWRMTTDQFGDYGTVVQCRNCRLVYKNPRETIDTFRQGYSDMNDHDYISEKETRRMNALLSLRSIKKFKMSGRLLDVGCSIGLVLYEAQFDFETMGVELSSWATEYAQKRIGLDVKHGILEEAKIPDSTFDVVTMIDVIEHLPDPAKTLKSIHRILKPGGLLYVVTPNINSFSSKVLGRYWWGLRPAHIIYFSDKTLRMLTKKVGFKWLQTESFGRIFTYEYWLSRIKNYPKIVYAPLKLIINIFGISEKILYLNTRDSMEAIVIKE